jgi:hypothetical protein
LPSFLDLGLSVLSLDKTFLFFIVIQYVTDQAFRLASD